MSAPAAPLTPADRTPFSALTPDEGNTIAHLVDKLLLGVAWYGRNEEKAGGGLGYEWRPIEGPWQTRSVSLYRGSLDITIDGVTRVVSADSETEVRAALTFAGLIPGQVSVTQPRVWNEGDPEPTGVKAVTDTGGERWEPSNSPGRWENTDRVTGYWSSLPWDRLAEILAPLTEVVDR